MKRIHIGKVIEKYIIENRISKVDFSKKIGFSRDATYKIFKKESITTNNLYKISEFLDHNFFQYYVETEPPTDKDVKDLIAAIDDLKRRLEK